MFGFVPVRAELFVRTGHRGKNIFQILKWRKWIKI